jgi:hypothetical protein
LSEANASQNETSAANAAKHRKKQFLTSRILLFQNETRCTENLLTENKNEADRM